MEEILLYKKQENASKYAVCAKILCKVSFTQRQKLYDNKASPVNL